MNRKQTAEAILSGELFSELVEEYQQAQFKAFINGPENPDVWAKARAAKELHSFIVNKCEGIVSE